VKFAADCMLGTLAKWLRVLGHDVVYDRVIEDGDLVSRAAREGRTLLTADRRLVRRRLARDHVLVTSHVLSEQIEQVLRERGLRLSSEPILGRCLRCNQPTETAPRETVRDLVPIYVYRTQERFTRCPSCARIYWRATHVSRMLERLGARASPAPTTKPNPTAARRDPAAGRGARRRAQARRSAPRR
jgi:uncharacterized protein